MNRNHQTILAAVVVAAIAVGLNQQPLLVVLGVIAVPVLWLAACTLWELPSLRREHHDSEAAKARQLARRFSRRSKKVRARERARLDAMVNACR